MKPMILIALLILLFFLLGSALQLFSIAALDHFIWPNFIKSIERSLFGERRLIINFTELRLLEEKQVLENFTLTLGTLNSRRFIIAVQKGHGELNKEFGETLFPDQLLSLPQIEYSINIRNTSKRYKLEKVKLEFQSDKQFVFDERSKTPNISFTNCGGFGTDYSCEIKIDLLKAQEKAFLLASTELPGFPRNITCQSVNAVDCSINYKRFYIKEIGEDYMMSLSGEIIENIPAANQNSKLMIYSYSPETKEWNALITLEQ